jgi:glycine/D-amino acid oxidase-like deaminating enzyme/nitrite reductase/ring-hydroxylating ferredoxin subunit
VIRSQAAAACQQWERRLLTESPGIGPVDAFQKTHLSHPGLRVATFSLWQEIGLPGFSPLSSSLAIDVAVVGGGMTGVTVACLLKAAGLKVAVFEKDRCGQKNTSSTTAHLTNVTDLRLPQLVEKFGKDHAQAVWDSHVAAFWQIEELVKTFHIACDHAMVPGYLCASLERADPEAETEELQREASLSNELGFPARFVPVSPVLHRPAICFPGQAIFHPFKYLAGLLNAVNGGGSHIFEQSEVVGIEAAGDAELVSLAVNGHTVRCHQVVIATDVPLQGKSGLVGATLLQTKLASYTSYALSARVPSGTAAAALFWDTSTPYNYLRIDTRPDHDRLIFGGCDHKTGQEGDHADAFTVLEERLRAFFPDAVIDHRWTGQVTGSHDGLPLIGETSPRQFIATGFSGNGITFGTLAAMMIRDQLTGQVNPWRQLYSPGRPQVLGGLYNYLTENLHYPYYMIKDRIVAGEKVPPSSLQRGEGKVLIHDGKRVAASRDVDGQLHVLSAVCTHMGCIVKWNDAEKSWDCPCHGARFDCTGKVLAGPA